MSAPGQFERFTLISGHFSLPSHSRISGNRYSMTLLRDPIRTILSMYTFWRGSAERSLATSVAKELSFPDFVRYFEWSPAVIFNRFTHHFAGLGLEFSGVDLSGPALLAMAKHNLSAFDFVGICEEYERSARLLCCELGWQVPAPLPHENRSWSEREIANIDEQTLRTLRDRNELDCELYAFGVALFHQRELANLSSSERSAYSGDLAREGDGVLSGVNSHRPKRTSFLPFPTPTESGRQARVETVSPKWLPDLESQLLELAVRFRTKVKIPDLILGLAVFDASGHYMWGTNTALEELDLPHEAYCICDAVFVISCSAPSGIYSVTVALHQSRNLGFHDHWLDRATFFEVTKQVSCPDADGFELRGFRSTVIRDSCSQSLPCSMAT